MRILLVKAAVDLRETPLPSLTSLGPWWLRNDAAGRDVAAGAGHVEGSAAGEPERRPVRR